MCVHFLFRNGFAVFCTKYFHKHAASGPHSMKDIGAAWHQLPLDKKNHYEKKAAKVGFKSLLLY